MKYLIRSLVIALALLFSGCPSVPQMPAAPPLREIGEGVIEHSASGMQFPVMRGEFTRVGTRQYDKDGLDVSAGYDLPSPSSPISATIYVYPSPPVHSFGSPESVVADAKSTLARGEFQRAKNEIVQAHSGATLLAEDSVSAPTAGHDSGYFARFTYSENFAGQVRPVESLLYVFCYAGDRWTIKYRITYPAGANARPAVDRLLQDLQWTVRKE